jgi:hypothetical protein
MLTANQDGSGTMVLDNEAKNCIIKEQGKSN